MSPVTTIDVFDCRIADAEASFEAEKCELLNPADGEAAIQTRRRYLKSVEAHLAELHDQRRRMAGGMPVEAGRIATGLVAVSRQADDDTTGRLGWLTPALTIP